MSIATAATTQIPRVQKGVPSGGEFSPRARAEAEINSLGLGFTEVDSGLSAEQSKAFAQAHLSELDMSVEFASESGDLRESAEHRARAKAHAEIALCAIDGGPSADLSARADRVLHRGTSAVSEYHEGWDGPGELSAHGRQEVLDFLRDREADMFTKGESIRDGAEAAPFYAAAVVYADAADELSGDATQFTGGEIV